MNSVAWDVDVYGAAEIVLGETSSLTIVSSRGVRSALETLYFSGQSFTGLAAIPSLRNVSRDMNT